MVAVVLVGLAAGVATTTISRVVQAEREKDLLFRGQAYQKAIKSYYDAGPPQAKIFPRSLNDLLQDPRFPGIKRHIRALYPDSMGKTAQEWMLVRVPGGGIAGVASKSKDKPLKTGGFPQGLESFTGKTSYAEWVFQYIALPAPVVPAKPVISR